MLVINLSELESIFFGSEIDKSEIVSTFLIGTIVIYVLLPALFVNFGILFIILYKLNSKRVQNNEGADMNIKTEVCETNLDNKPVKNETVSKKRQTNVNKLCRTESLNMVMPISDGTIRKEELTANFNKFSSIDKACTQVISGH